jgi:hypothetical protein
VLPVSTSIPFARDDSHYLALPCPRAILRVRKEVCMPLFDDLSPEQQKELQELHEAFRQEFEEGREKAGAKAAITDLEDLKEDALNAIKAAINQRENKKLASDVARWAYDKLIDQGKASVDPLTEMVKEAERARSSQ